MAVVATLLTENSSASSATSYATASITASPYNLVLLSVSSRTGITADPNQPTASGGGITWVVVNSTVYDNDSSSRRRITLLRGMVAVPTAGAITIDFAGQTQTNCQWSITQFAGVDTSGTNGSGAIVQSATNRVTDTESAATSLTVTLAAFGSANNATFGAFANEDAGWSDAVGSGFTLLSSNADVGTDGLTTEWRNDNDTSVDLTFNSQTGVGGIAVEIKASSNVFALSYVTNSASSGTAMSVSAPTGTTTGDLVVCVVHGNGQTTIADNNGATPFTEHVNDYKPNDAGGHTLSIFSRVIQGGDPATYNFTLGATGRWAISAVTYRNINTGSNFDITPSITYINNENNFDDSTVDAPTITTTNNGSLHIAGAIMDSGTTLTFTLPSGYGDFGSITTNQPIALCYKIITSAAATGAQSFTLAGDTGCRMGFSYAVNNISTTSVKDIIGCGFIPFAR